MTQIQSKIDIKDEIKPTSTGELKQKSLLEKLEQIGDISKITISWSLMFKAINEDLNKITDIDYLIEGRNDLKFIVQQLKIDYLNNTRWVDRNRKIQAIRLQDIIKAINLRIIKIQTEQREVRKAKEQAEKEKTKLTSKVLVDVLDLLSQRQANRAAQSSFRARQLTKEQLVAAAPEMPMPEFKNTPEGQTDKDIVELAKKEIESDPSIDSLTAMLKVQKEVADKGLPMENFDLSQLISNSKPESKSE